MKDESRGQSMVMARLLTVMMGMSALVLDVGSWQNASSARTTADASALAGKA
jgi:hypothetical protein